MDSHTDRSECGIAALFRYGAVVLFNASADEKSRLLGMRAAHSSGPGDIGAEEVAMIHVGPDAEEGPSGQYIRIKNANRLRLQRIAEVIGEGDDVVLPGAARGARLRPQRTAGARPGRGQALPGKTGGTAQSGRQHAAGGKPPERARRVLDRPDLLWNNPGLSGLYARLEGDYELHDRAAALDRQRTTLSHTSETLVETMRYHSAHRLETAIFLLIVVELCLGLYGHFGH